MDWLESVVCADSTAAKPFQAHQNLESDFSKFKELETKLWPPPTTNKKLGTTVAPESLKVPKCMLCQQFALEKAYHS